jgi:hypothetical protein
MEQQRAYGNLTLNLSIPLFASNFYEPRHQSQNVPSQNIPSQNIPSQDASSQLVNELASHLTANLTSPGLLNNVLKNHINKSLANRDCATVAEAVHAITDELAIQLANQLPHMLEQQLGVANSSKPTPEPSVPEQPQTAEEYSTYLDNFIEENLANFYPPEDERVKELAKRAADQAQAVTDKFHLSPELTTGLAKLALYDFVILCGKAPLYSLLESVFFALRCWLNLSGQIIAHQWGKRIAC